MACLPTSSVLDTWPAGAKAAANTGGEDESQRSAHNLPDIHEHGHGTSKAGSAGPSTLISPLAGLTSLGRAVGGSAMPQGDHEGGMITSMVSPGQRFPSECGAGLHDAGEVGQKKHVPRQLHFVVKFCAVLAGIATAVVLYITQQGPLGQGSGGTTVSPKYADQTAIAWTPYSTGRLRSESFNRIGSPTKVRGSLARVAALPPSPPASSFQHQSRSLGDAALTVDTTAGGGGGGGGEGDSSSLKKRARIGYLIMLSGVEELHKTKRLLKAIYDPNNFYLVHLDRKDNRAIRKDMENFIADWDNVRMLVPSLDVSWGGYTITLTAIFGLCTMVQWSDEWDFFINLSASDFPLLPQSELTAVLGQYADVGMNFVSGAPLNERNRVEVLIDDQGLYRETQSSKAGRPLKVAKPRLPPSKSMFTVFKGEFWVILHRSFCRYIEASPDNVARSLQAYFSRFRISDESYFQTVLCHPLAPSFRVHPDNLRFVSWPSVSEGHYVLHPDPITGGAEGNVNLAMDSGALFARKFDSKVSQEAYTVLEGSLSKAKPGRQARVVNRLNPAAAVTGRQRFCAIPEGYSIQEVLSHPPKKAMGVHEDTRASDMSGGSTGNNGGGSSFPVGHGQDQDRSPVQMREVREGGGGRHH